MSRISGAHKLIRAKQPDYDKARCESCFFHVAFYEAVTSFDQFEKSGGRI
jgi:hypothetical protein